MYGTLNHVSSILSTSIHTQIVALYAFIRFYLDTQQSVNASPSENEISIAKKVAQQQFSLYREAKNEIVRDNKQDKLVILLEKFHV